MTTGNETTPRFIDCDFAERSMGEQSLNRQKILFFFNFTLFFVAKIVFSVAVAVAAAATS